MTHTPTTDHAEPRQEGCQCKPWSLCAGCYARLEQGWAKLELAGWLPKFGSRVNLPRAPKR